MATPLRPGWYPAPDGSATEQWWNGASWSDTKRGVGGAPMPGLPAYRATPPPVAPGSEAAPPLPPTQPPYPTLASQTGARSINVSNSTPTIALIFGIIGLFAFAPLGVVGIVLGVIALRRPSTLGTQRSLAIGGIVAGIIALVLGAINLVIFIVTISSGINLTS